MEQQPFSFGNNGASVEPVNQAKCLYSKKNWGNLSLPQRIGEPVRLLLGKIGDRMDCQWEVLAE